MATKLQHTPTTNLFAILADEQNVQTQQSAKKLPAQTAQSTKSLPETTPTPKARAEVKAQQEERRKKEVEKSRPADVEGSDLEGFSLQRNQRVKEKKLTPPEPVKETGKQFKDRKPYHKDRPHDKTEKTFGADGKEEKPFKEINRQPRGPGGYKQDKVDRPQGGGGGGGGALRADGDDNRPARGRDYDKHSQGKYSNKPTAKRQGHGRGNWDTPVPSKIDDQPVADNNVVPSVTEGDEPVGAVGDGVAPSDENQFPINNEADNKETDKTEKKEEGPKEMSLEEYENLKAEKMKELDAIVSPTKTKAISEEEKQRSLSKFKVFENKKAKPTPAVTKEVKVHSTESVAPAKTPAARKGETPLPLDEVFTIKSNSPYPGGGRGRGGRGRGEGGRGRGRGGDRGDRADRPVDKREPVESGSPPESPAPRPSRGGRGGKAQKIVRNESQFPSLG